MNYTIFFLLTITCSCFTGCSGKPALQEGKVKITSTADLGQAVGTGKPGKK